MKKLRILTTVHFANPGACLFTESLYNILASNLPGYDVRTLDYVPRNWLYYEKLRAFKPHPHIPSFNLQRHRVAEEFYRQRTHLDRPTAIFPFGYERQVDFLIRQGYDALVVGMVIWDIVELRQIPKFPNIFWLSEQIPSVKIAYAASGHRSNADLVRKNLPAIQRILGSYALIGVRDRITWEIVMESKVDEFVPVVRVPDPTFLHPVQPSPVLQTLERYGIDPQRPLVGMLFYGKPEFSEKMSAYYHSKGFQTVAFSMYNPYADANVGHILTPDEWADLFNYLSFCVTDRFHGTIFCLKANIPFLSIEPYQPKTMRNSKVFSLISDFELPECYADVYREGFTPEQALKQMEALRSTWATDYSPHVAARLSEMRQSSLDFVSQIQAILN